MNSLLIAENIIKRALRNKKELVLMLLLPVMAVCIITYATGSNNAQTVSAGLVNLDEGIYGSKMVSYIKGIENLKIVSLKNSNYAESIKNSAVNFVIVIPEGFSDEIAFGQKTSITFYSSGTNETSEKIKSLINGQIMNYYIIDSAANKIHSASGMEKVQIAGKMFDAIKNGNVSSAYSLSKSSTYSKVNESLISSIGFAIMFMMVLIFNTIGTIMEDKKNLTLARICTFQVQGWEIAAGNIIGSLFLGILQLIPVTVSIGIIYKVKLPDLMAIFMILVCFIAAVIGIGVGVSGLIKNSFVPSLIIAEVIFPTCLVGGCFIPDSMLPSFMSRIGYVVPQKWVLDAIRDVMNGAAISGIAFKAGIILLFGLAFATLGVKTLKPISD